MTEAFRHPGAAAHPRVLATEVREPRELRVEIPSGRNAGTVLRELMARHGFRGATGRICSGTALALQYHVVIKAAQGDRPYIYGTPTLEHDEVALLHGAVTIGLDRAGSIALHCHGAFVDHDGHLHGGHVILDRLEVGREPLVLRLCAFEHGGFTQYIDEETRYTLFGPTVEVTP
ncbi:PCC domain-containing protein [Paraburkholderia phenazinium]|uniref:PCC domain-containing protein n=1 Tax=Paraburkholderia phenazinium TaxID=60549 RepID=UPI001FC7D2E7|nr:DUF296 domain-containing protein [Paraburkholderia phenazinium]